MNGKIGAAALAAGLLALGAAHAEPGRYWGLHLGGNAPGTWDSRVDFGAGVAFDGQAELKHGAHGGLQVGHATAHARYELEYEHGTLRFDRLTLGPVSEAVSGRGHYDALFGNAYRTDRLTDTVGSFVGGGIGWGRVKLPTLGLGSTDCACFGPASKSGFAWQLRAGLEYRLNPESAIALQYTWLGLPAPEARSSLAIDYARHRFGAWSAAYSRHF